MKEGSYYEWLQQQLLEDYFKLKSEVLNDSEKVGIAAHIAKAQVAIGELYGRIKARGV